LLLVVLALAGTRCDSGDAPVRVESTEAQPAQETVAATGGGSASVRAEAEEIFNTRCQTCHGPEGAGDGPGAAGLTPKPRNFQDPAFQDSVSDEHIGNIIQYGGAAVGKSPTMPGNPDLMSQPELVKELVTVVRELGRS
jgi:mono/diheme cytochrome c family protein